MDRKFLPNIEANKWLEYKAPSLSVNVVDIVGIRDSKKCDIVQSVSQSTGIAHPNGVE